MTLIYIHWAFVKEREKTVCSTFYAELASFLCDFWKSKFETCTEGLNGAGTFLHRGSHETSIYLPVYLRGKGTGIGSDSVALASLELNVVAQAGLKLTVGPPASASGIVGITGVHEHV